MVFRTKKTDPECREIMLAETYTNFIFEACMKNIILIGKHKHGCCVMQRCLEMGTMN